MKRTIGAMLVLGVLVVVPAGAGADEPGCTAVGVSPDPITCTYTADGSGTYTAITSNPWTITVVRDEEVVTLASGTIYTPYSTGEVATLAGEVVTVTIRPQRTMGVPRPPHGMVRAGRDG